MRGAAQLNKIGLFKCAPIFAQHTGKQRLTGTGAGAHFRFRFRAGGGGCLWRETDDRGAWKMVGRRGGETSTISHFRSKVNVRKSRDTPVATRLRPKTADAAPLYAAIGENRPRLCCEVLLTR